MFKRRFRSFCQMIITGGITFHFYYRCEISVPWPFIVFESPYSVRHEVYHNIMLIRCKILKSYTRLGVLVERVGETA